MKLYVGNLSWNIGEDEVREMFEEFGEVDSVKLITDRETGRSRGFAFVEMENGEDAMNELNGRELDGRNLKINEARERDNRGGGGGRGRGGFGGGGGYGGGGYRGGSGGGRY